MSVHDSIEVAMATDEQRAAYELSRLRCMTEFRYQMRKFLNFSETASERCGVGAQQYQLMQVIAAIPAGQEASITYVAERMVLRHNSTVELVDRAERAGLVKRESDPKDMRRSLVRLTGQGEEILERLIEEHLRELPLRIDDLIGAVLPLRDALHSTFAEGNLGV